MDYLFFLVVHVMKRNVHLKKARAGRRKLSCQVTLLDIKAMAALKRSDNSGGLCINFHRFFWVRLKVFSSGHSPVLGKQVFICGANLSRQNFL